MIGDIDVRTSVRLIASAAELSPFRITSVVTGSASAAMPWPTSPARWMIGSASDISGLLRIGEEQHTAGASPRGIAGVEVSRGGGLEDDRRARKPVLVDRDAVDHCEREVLAPGERPGLDRRV